MNLYFKNLPAAFSEGTQRLLAMKNCAVSADGIPISVQPGDAVHVQIGNGAAQITYPAGGFFRALGLLLEHLNEDQFSITEQPRFERLGVQLDFSR